MTSELELVRKLGKILTERKWSCTTAESCTGGRVSAAITEIPASSQWFERGFVTYSNESKSSLLGVPSQEIDSFGAVSESVAASMAKGAIHNSKADVSVAI